MDKLDQLKSAIQKFAKDRDWDQFHSPKNLSMAMSVEAAEIVEIFQWLTEEQSKKLAKGKVDDLRWFGPTNSFTEFCARLESPSFMDRARKLQSAI